MAKTCKKDGCFRPVFSHLFCLNHQYLRTDKKVKKDFPKIKITTVRDDLQTSFGFSSQFEMFQALWDSVRNLDGSVTCKYTGEKLLQHSPYYINYFAHILNKKNYPWFKINPANVEIVALEFHRIVDAGTQKERAEHPTWKWDLWDARVIQMKQEYIAFKKKNLLA